MTPFYAAPFTQRIEKEGQLQNIIRIAWGGSGLDDEALHHRARLDVFSGVLGRGGASRLYLKIREELGLVYGIGCGFDDNMDGTLFEIGTATEPENEAVLLKEVDQEIERIQDTMPTEEELVCAKNGIKSGEYRAADSSYATALKVGDEVFYGDLGTDDYLAAVDRVTAEDVCEVAKKVFSGNRYMVIGQDNNSKE
jgi:predicted Zn-dependent peptidase